MKNIYKNIEILSITFKSDHIIEKCLDGVNKRFNVTIVENSNRLSFKKKMEKRKNTKCILTGSNLGFGKAFNIGAKQINKKFILHINPDVKINDRVIKELYKIGSKIKHLGILSPTETSKETKILKKNKSKLMQADHVKGFVMFMNNHNCKKVNYFDDNFFLYLEEIDLCKRLKMNGSKIYKAPNILVKHLGGKSHSPKIKEEMELQRNWHYLWSLFYFTKKHYGYFSALKKTLGKFISAFLKLIIYFFINKKKYQIYKHRFNGLLASYLCLKASFRI